MHLSGKNNSYVGRVLWPSEASQLIFFLCCCKILFCSPGRKIVAVWHKVTNNGLAYFYFFLCFTYIFSLFSLSLFPSKFIFLFQNMFIVLQNVYDFLFYFLFFSSLHLKKQNFKFCSCYQKMFSKFKICSRYTTK